MNSAILREFILAFDFSRLSRDERNLLIEYHSRDDRNVRDLTDLRDYRLAELRVSKRP